MDISRMGTVLAIVVICYLVGMAAKQCRRIPDHMIPVIVGVCGGLLAIPGMYVIPDFPAKDLISAIAVGIVSGLSSTGVHQIWKQSSKTKQENSKEEQ